MKNIFRILPILFFSFLRILSAQPTIVWENTFGGTWTDFSGDILVAEDGNYLALCNPSSPNGDFVGDYGNTDIWLMKLDQTGQVIWKKNYGGTNADGASHIISSGDGGYLILGSTRSNDFDVSGNHGNTDIWLLKIDQNGTILWQKTYGGSELEGGGSIIPTNDGCYMITSYTYSNDFDVPANNHGESDLWVIKIKANGDIVWSKLYGGSNQENRGKTIQTSDNGFVISGSTLSDDGDVGSNQGGSDIWTLKIDSIGTIQWITARGGTDNDYSNGLVLTSDGGYLVANFSASTNGTFSQNHGGFDSWVYKLDASGVVQWEKMYGGSDWELMNGIFQMADGNCILLGTAQSIDGDLTENDNPNAWLLCIDQSGNILWNKTYGGTQTESFSRVRQISNTEFLVMGTAASTDGDVQSGTPNNNGDIWVVRMSLTSGMEDVFSSPLDLNIFPNPTSNDIEIVSEDQLENCIFSIVTTDGALLLRQSLGASRRIDISSLPAGSYMLRFECGKKNSNKMIVKQ